jgi:hypothetical protein
MTLKTLANRLPCRGLGVGGYLAWRKLGGDSLPPGFASGNGIEAVEIDIATNAGTHQEHPGEGG